MRYLLDTNIVSDLVRYPDGRVAQHIRRIGDTQVCTSIMVAAELRYGAAKKQSPRLTAQIEAVLGGLEILPWKAPADVVYGTLRAELQRTGKLISANDLFIKRTPWSWITQSSLTMKGSLLRYESCAGKIGSATSEYRLETRNWKLPYSSRAASLAK